MRALVTGGAGYFGELLSTKLLERGYWIRIFDVNRPTLTYPGIEVMQGDIRDSEAILTACEGIDIAFHNVAQVPLAKDKKLFPFQWKSMAKPNLPERTCAGSTPETVWMSQSSGPAPSWATAGWEFFKSSSSGFTRERTSPYSMTAKTPINSSTRMTSPKPAFRRAL